MVEKVFKMPDEAIILMKYDSGVKSYLPVTDRIIRNLTKATAIDFIGNMGDMVKKNEKEYPNLKKLEIIYFENYSHDLPEIYKSIDKGSEKGIVNSCHDAIDEFDSDKNYKKFFKNLTNNFRKKGVGLIMYLDNKQENPVFKKLDSFADYIIEYPNSKWLCRVLKKP